MSGVAGQEIRDFAGRLGLNSVGFSTVAAPPRAEAFSAWLEGGMAGTMTYLHRQANRRLDPARILDGARTIISVSLSYFSENLPAEIRSDPSRGIIAAYAWGADYHEVLLDKLNELARFIESKAPGSHSRCYVDTGPLLERAHAERAGLGFVGKNTMLISPRQGSHMFLGEILTTEEIEAGELRRQPSCGSCTRCQTECPTFAFPAPYILDSNLCISYLTIEFRGIIPRELRSKMGNHVFGCDDCQDCCPWNERFSTVTSEARFRSEVERRAPLLCELARMSEAEYRERFHGSAVLRASYVCMLRNVAIALGNWGADSAMESI